MGDDVRIRDVEAADLEVFYAHQHDAEAARRARFPPRDHERFMTHWTTKILGDSSVLVQTVTVDGAPAGNVVAWWEEGQRFIGYWLGQEHWGRGIGFRALALFLRRESVRPLYADPYVGNVASVGLLEKSGFRRVGVIRRGDDEHVMLELS